MSHAPVSGPADPDITTTTTPAETEKSAESAAHTAPLRRFVPGGSVRLATTV